MSYETQKEIRRLATTITHHQIMYFAFGVTSGIALMSAIVMIVLLGWYV